MRSMMVLALVLATSFGGCKGGSSEDDAGSDAGVKADATEQGEDANCGMAFVLLDETNPRTICATSIAEACQMGCGKPVCLVVEGTPLQGLDCEQSDAGVADAGGDAGGDVGGGSGS